MSWRQKVSTPVELALITAAHEKAWNEIEARANINSLDYQAEHDRLGDIFIELWELHSEDDNLLTLAITRFDAARDPAKLCTHCSEPEDEGCGDADG